MTYDLKQHKKDLRQQMLHLRDSMQPATKRELDKAIRARLATIIKERNAKIVHSYLPMGSEVNVFPLLAELLNSGITVISPKTLPKRQLQNLVLHSVAGIEQGMWGTIHPAGGEKYPGPIDLFIVPGLAFDNERYRLGYGAGYYDNHLVHHPDAYKVAVAYPFQLIEKVPVEEHDIRLDEVIV
jgi:5-formyltetrahydrofolate cyclo-ligase